MANEISQTISCRSARSAARLALFLLRYPDVHVTTYLADHMEDALGEGKHLTIPTAILSASTVCRSNARWRRHSGKTDSNCA